MNMQSMLKLQHFIDCCYIDHTHTVNISVWNFWINRYAEYNYCFADIAILFPDSKRPLQVPKIQKIL